jgi:nondiscriminating aspartyl-tRNA synthetase
MGDFAFVILRKSTGLMQCVYNKTDEAKDKEILKLETSLRVTGDVRDEERAVNGIELVIDKAEVLSRPESDMEFNVNRYKLNIAIENELPIRPIVLRNEQRRSVFKLTAVLTKAFKDYLDSNDFTEIHSPKIVAAGAEGGANIFKLEYFGKKAYLAQSPQFYKQMMIPVYERVYEIAPVFRAEKHNTTRHLNEYMGVDFEMGFINSFYDIINVETGMIKYALDYVRENHADLFKKACLNKNIEIPTVDKIPCVKFKDAKEMVAAKYNRKIKDPFDLEPEEERLIGELFKEEYGSDFVFVTDYPVKKRPFYAMDDPENPKYTLSFDLLFRGLEVTTGGQRIHDYNTQVEKMKSKNLNPEDFESYLMLHKYGCPPHGGLGMGLERFVMQLLGLDNIRMTSMFPRDTLRLNP